MKHRSWKEVSIKGDGLSSEERGNTVMGMSMSATNVWPLPSVKGTFISVEDRWFRTYVNDALGAVNNCYIAQLRNDSNVGLLRGRKERYRTYEEIEEG